MQTCKVNVSFREKITGQIPIVLKLNAQRDRSRVSSWHHLLDPLRGAAEGQS